MIGAVEANKAFGMARLTVNMRRVINTDNHILRGMKNHQGAIEVFNFSCDILVAYIFKELFFDDKGPSSKQNLGFARFFYFFELICKLVNDMCRIAR